VVVVVVVVLFASTEELRCVRAASRAVRCTRIV
jgi:hypothetical protein